MPRIRSPEAIDTDYYYYYFNEKYRVHKAYGDGWVRLGNVRDEKKWWDWEDGPLAHEKQLVKGDLVGSHK